MGTAVSGDQEMVGGDQDAVGVIRDTEVEPVRLYGLHVERGDANCVTLHFLPLCVGRDVWLGEYADPGVAVDCPLLGLAVGLAEVVHEAP